MLFRKIMTNSKYQITNEPRSSSRGVGESRSSVMGVDEYPIPKHKLTNTKYEPRIRNHYLRPPYFFLCHCEGLSPEAISLFIVNTGDCHASINRGSQWRFVWIMQFKYEILDIDKIYSLAMNTIYGVIALRLVLFNGVHPRFKGVRCFYCSG